jgi:hypothetical protein
LARIGDGVNELFQNAFRVVEGTGLRNSGRQSIRDQDSPAHHQQRGLPKHPHLLLVRPVHDLNREWERENIRLGGLMDSRCDLQVCFIICIDSVDFNGCTKLAPDCRFTSDSLEKGSST